MKTKRTIKYSMQDKVTLFVIYALLGFAAIAVLLPLINVVSQSFSEPMEVYNGRVGLIPVKLTLGVYSYVFQNKMLLSGYTNSIFYAITGTMISLTLTIMGAYPLSRKKLYGRSFFMAIFTITMLFNGGLIPTYLVIKSLGLIDTRWALLLPSAVGVWNLIIARTFFMQTIPEELYEAAEIDGASDIQTLIKIVLPVSKPILAVLTLFYAVGIWNSYFNALIYLSSNSKFPLQLVLRDILLSSQMQADLTASSGKLTGSEQLALTESIKYAIIVVASVPVLMLYPFIQKHFTRGIMVGTLKG